MEYFYMKSIKWINSDSDKLFEAILLLQNLDETRRFFRDLLTEEEIEEFSKRFKAAIMLSEKISYSKIVRETGLSSTTVARVSKWLNEGMDGYRLVLDRISHHQESDNIGESS